MIDDRRGRQRAVPAVPAVRSRPGAQLDAESVRDHVAAHLAASKVPSVVEIRQEDLPRNATGKVLKRQLRDELAAGRPSGT